MGLLKQVIAEMDPNAGTYGGISGLDKVDKLKNNPKAVALPFTRYLQQRNAENEEEDGAPEDMHNDDIDAMDEPEGDDTDSEGGSNVEQVIQRIQEQPDNAYQIVFNAIQNGEVEDVESFKQVMQSVGDDPSDHDRLDFDRE